jgi:hypothetical protein
MVRNMRIVAVDTLIGMFHSVRSDDIVLTAWSGRTESRCGTGFQLGFGDYRARLLSSQGVSFDTSHSSSSSSSEILMPIASSSVNVIPSSSSLEVRSSSASFSVLTSSLLQWVTLSGTPGSITSSPSLTSVCCQIQPSGNHHLPSLSQVRDLVLRLRQLSCWLLYPAQLPAHKLYLACKFIGRTTIRPRTNSDNYSSTSPKILSTCSAFSISSEIPLMIRSSAEGVLSSSTLVETRSSSLLSPSPTLLYSTEVQTKIPLSSDSFTALSLFSTTSRTTYFPSSATESTQSSHKGQV